MAPKKRANSNNHHSLKSDNSNNGSQGRIEPTITRKAYQKDKERNILPNAVSKIFFFLKSSGKSESLLSKILAAHPELGSKVTASKFYIYQSFLKSNRGRFMTIESLQDLFTLRRQD